MRISTFISFLVVVAIVLFAFALMTQEAKDKYPTYGINDSDWSGKYNYITNISEDIAPLKATFEKIEDENVGWFTKITSGIVAVPKAVIAFVKVTLSTLIAGGSMTTGMLFTLGIPLFIIVAITLLAFIWAMTKLIEIWQRWQV